MTFKITRQDIEREAGWSSRYYGITPQHALQVEASYILTDRSRLHLDSQETEIWLRQFFPATTKEAQEVKTNFLKLRDSMIQTDEDRKAHDAAYDEYMDEIARLKDLPAEQVIQDSGETIPEGKTISEILQGK